MLFHLTIIMLMMAALAAFLILWYFWVKRRLTVSCFLHDEEQVLFPFRYFCWVLLGVVLLTCAAQIHFVRLSARYHEEIAAQTLNRPVQTVSREEMAEVKQMIETLQGRMESGFRRMTQLAQTLAPQSGEHTRSAAMASNGGSTSKSAPGETSLSPEGKQSGFGKAAGTYTITPVAKMTPKSLLKPKTKTKSKEVRSMRLDLMGQVMADVLRVRRRPDPAAAVIGRLQAGEVVRVTEKCFVDDSLWFRIVPSSSKPGWVDFRYLKLLTTAKSPSKSAPSDPLTSG